MRAGVVGAAVCLLGALGWGARAQLASETLVMWGDEQPPRGTVTGVSLDGVEVVSGDGVTTLVGWDRVREVVGERAAAFEPVRDRARAIWRAGVRLERGDLINAEPVLEGLFETLAWERGPAASFVSRGLLTCRLGRGARGAAVVPWLSVLVSADGRPGRMVDDADARVIDQATGLASGLAPVWARGDTTVRMAREPIGDGPDADTSGRVQLLGALYQQSARFELSPGEAPEHRAAIGDAINAAEPGVVDEDGVSLVLEMVLARVGTDEQRASSRAALEARLLGRMPAWKEAWVRVGIGRSLVLEADAEARRRGVIQLLHVPARLASDSPVLASLALAEAALTLRDLGSAREADLLRRELLERFPRSEGARLDEISAWSRSGPTVGARPSTSTHGAGPGPAKEGTPRT